MAKIQITITQNGIYDEDEKIVEIEINRGNWKYWDKFSKDNEKTTLTMNNFYDATLLQRPVKDAVAHYDKKELENGNLVMDNAYIRTYDTLMEYLNWRIKNLKEMNSNKLERNIMLFEQDYVKNDEDEVIKDIEYTQDELIKVVIEKIQ